MLAKCMFLQKRREGQVLFSEGRKMNRSALYSSAPLWANSPAGSLPNNTSPELPPAVNQYLVHELPVMKVKEEDWGDTRTAGQCLSDICLSDNLSDISFTFTKNPIVKLPAHKFVLSMRSKVFEAMFCGPLAESGKTVLIEDIEPETMKVLLRFMYSDKPEINGDNVLCSLYAAKKYALAGLVKVCSAYLENNIDTNNVCSIHEQSVFYDMKPLQTKCFQFILENTFDVFTSPGFLEVSQATLLNLLKSDELSEDEDNIFQACIKWANHHCQTYSWTLTSENVRKCLGEAVYQVRFAIMPIDVFAKVVGPTGILSSEEQVMLYQYLATEGSTPLSKFAHGERSGRVITVGLSNIQYQSHGNIVGYIIVLSIQNQANKIETSLKLRSVTGTFVQNIQQIWHSNQDITYRIRGNKIIFKSPINVVHGTTIQFHEGNDRSVERINNGIGMSRQVFEHVEVNGNTVLIHTIPVGLTSISFAR